MSGAADNSLKQWLFDSADGTARLLRFRSGHSAPPSCLKFYGSGNKLLSAGLQQFQSTHWPSHSTLYIAYSCCMCWWWQSASTDVPKQLVYFFCNIWLTHSV